MLVCMLSLRLTACNIRYACRGCLEIIIVTAFLELPWHLRMHFRWLLQRGDFRYFFCSYCFSNVSDTYTFTTTVVSLFWKLYLLREIKKVVICLDYTFESFTNRPFYHYFRCIKKEKGKYWLNVCNKLYLKAVISIKLYALFFSSKPKTSWVRRRALKMSVKQLLFSKGGNAFLLPKT